MTRLTHQELDRLTSDLGSFVRSGVPLPDGLRHLEQNLQRGPLKRVAAHLATELDRGVPLSAALESSPVAIPEEYTAVLKCAEISGDMGAVLDFAVDHSRRLQQHRSSVITALIYPVFILLTLITVGAFVLRYIVPKFVDIYNQLGAELPAPTQMLVALASFLAGPGIILLIAAALLLIAIAVSDHLRRRVAAFLTRMPGLRSLSALSDTAVFMKFIGRMTARGIPLPDSLRAASLAMWQPSTRASLCSMAGAAEGGHAVAPLLSPYVPATAAWLFEQAERRGDLPEACEGIADYCEDRFDRLSKHTTALLEPALILLVSLFIAVTVISLYLPLFNIGKIVGGE